MIICFYQNSATGGLSCVHEVKNIYKNLLSEFLKEKPVGKGNYLSMIIEKNYCNKKTEKDTIMNIFSNSKRVKIYNRYFTIHSNGKAYVTILPGMQRIGIQRIKEHKNNEVPTNPIEKFSQISDSLISDKNFQSCREFTDAKNRRCKELILKFKTEHSKFPVIETMHYIVDMNNSSLISVEMRYKNATDIKEEKYILTTVDTDYTLPWDLICPLEQTVFEHENKPRKEFKNYHISDLRKEKYISE